MIDDGGGGGWSSNYVVIMVSGTSYAPSALTIVSNATATPVQGQNETQKLN